MIYLTSIINSFAGNSAILRYSCNKEATFYLTINVFGVNNTFFRGRVLYACSSNSQELFTKNIYPQHGNALFSQYHNIIIISNAHETVN